MIDFFFWTTWNGFLWFSVPAWVQFYFTITHYAKMMFIKQFGTAKLKIQNEEVLNNTQ